MYVKPCSMGQVQVGRGGGAAGDGCGQPRAGHPGSRPGGQLRAAHAPDRLCAPRRPNCACRPRGMGAQLRYPGAQKLSAPRLLFICTSRFSTRWKCEITSAWVQRTVQENNQQVSSVCRLRRLGAQLRHSGLPACLSLLCGVYIERCAAMYMSRSCNFARGKGANLRLKEGDAGSGQ